MKQLGLAVVLLALLPAPASHAGTVGTLSLDGLSFIAFEGFENVPLPSGSQIRFHFADVSGASSSFTIAPSDVTIPPIEVRPGAILTYSLGSTATGTIRNLNGAIQIEFDAVIQASLSEAGESGSRSYALRFTTREATATNAAQTESVEVEGMPVVRGPNYVQVVAGATNQPDVFPGPGAAVYGVLSGSFDALPQLP